MSECENCHEDHGDSQAELSISLQLKGNSIVCDSRLGGSPTLDPLQLMMFDQLATRIMVKISEIVSEYGKVSKGSIEGPMVNPEMQALVDKLNAANPEPETGPDEWPEEVGDLV